MSQIPKEAQSTDIILSEEACRASIALQKENPQWQGLSLRLYLDSKGCSGFVYGLSFDQVKSDDIHFKHTYDGKIIDLITDPDTFLFVKGSTIVWKENAEEKGYIVENPRHNRFRGKFYKRSYWQKKLKEKLGSESESC